MTAHYTLREVFISFSIGLCFIGSFVALVTAIIYCIRLKGIYSKSMHAPVK
jgi:hypothetical protein